ncbi:MAG TPA: NAD(P)H-hydrate dehydratase, partial [Clostridiales bacterium]|nr:NAD(P)H-hydrate dehydratase [Clostridiales bacterium]
KIGNINYPGAEYNGEWILKDIGIPPQIIEKMDLNVHLITKEMVKGILPLREKDTHKGTYGKICMIAGSVGMAGAAILAGKSALVSGAGLLKIAVPKAINDILQQKVPEAITVPLEESEKEFIHSEDAEKLLRVMKNSDVIAIGPGCGQGRQFHEIFHVVLEHAVQPVVMDADALNILSKDVEMLSRLRGPVVMSPHIAEMSRLTGKDIQYIAQNRIEIASAFAQRWNCTVVLKGARTVVADGKGKIFINQTGNPGMATAGSGDVLTGLIAGLVAQGIAPVDAAVAAVYIHGSAGDRAAKRLGEYGLLAGDIASEIPLVLKELLGV